MNKDYEIYQAPRDDIPAEDAARLDGYLHARAKAAEYAALKAKLEAFELEAFEQLRHPDEP